MFNTKWTVEERNNFKMDAARSVSQAIENYDVTKVAVSALEHDLCDRSGLKHAWSEIEESVKENIRYTWKEILFIAFNKVDLQGRFKSNLRTCFNSVNNGKQNIRVQRLDVNLKIIPQMFVDGSLNKLVVSNGVPSDHLVIETEFNYARQVVEFYILSDTFPEIRPGQIIPNFVPIVKRVP